MNKNKTLFYSLLCALLFVGCGDDSSADAGVDGAMSDVAVADVSSDTMMDGGSCVPVAEDQAPPEPGMCEAQPTDYSVCADDMWPACVSDFGEYVPVEETISTIARVGGFERIADFLFDPATTPSSDDFLAARMIYQEDEGLDSRVVRRYDPHFEVPEGTDCSEELIPGMFMDYCTGPAQIQPILLDALMRGFEEEAPRFHAGRVEGALLRFLYVSTYKEGLTCTTKAKDCDSAYAYYTGGAEARGGLGLAARVAAADPLAHDRAWDGLLALRCWRDLDPEETATDLELRERARNQYDRAILDGVAAVVIQHLVALRDTTGEEQGYHFGFFQALAPVLERETRARMPAQADLLVTELGRDDAAVVDADALIAALGMVFDCP